MTKHLVAGAVSALLFSPMVHAATEYLRFEGSISPYYDEYAEGYDPSLGLQAGQTVYFDFSLDTAVEATGYTDSAYTDFFAVSYLAGSVNGYGPTHGATASFPEGYTTWLFLPGSLRVGPAWDSLGNPSDESIATWSVGDWMPLLYSSYFSDNAIGNLQLTYRDGVQPPAYVPLPASLWLLGSGIALLFPAMHRRYSRP